MQSFECTSDGAEFGCQDSMACQVRARLRGSSYPELRQLECAVADGVLAVRGRLPSFYLKQVALSLIGSVAEFERFDDGIEVLTAWIGRCNRSSVRFDSGSRVSPRTTIASLGLNR